MSKSSWLAGVVGLVFAMTLAAAWPSRHFDLEIGHLVSPASAATTSPDPSVVGQWSQLYSWPEVAIHMIVLPDGRILTFTDPVQNDGLQTPASGYVVVIPAGGAPGAAMYVPNGTDDIFYAGATFLGSGRLLVAGGTNTAGVKRPGHSCVQHF
jgi:hypothetical protein